VHLVQKQVRPIVREKKGQPVEFGAKNQHHCGEWFFPFLTIASSWMPYNEGGDLIAQAEKYKEEGLLP